MVQSLAEQVFAELGRIAEGTPSPRSLNGALRLLSKWRAALIQDQLLRTSGTRVLSGVFAGMDFLPTSTEGCHVPKLLGTYEQPLQPAIEAAIARGYRQVVNIGCAEGYYAAGLARRMPTARVLAFDTNVRAQETCRALAEKNGVGERVIVKPEFAHEDFAPLAGTETLIVCDIEGAEEQLLDPQKAPALRALDIVVEVHDCLKRGLSDELARRFAATHDMARIDDDGQRRLENAPPWFTALQHLDQLLAVWEWRTGPTPWLILRARARS